jgi:hypothetical protein
VISVSGILYFILRAISSFVYLFLGEVLGDLLIGFICSGSLGFGSILGLFCVALMRSSFF